MLFHVRFPISIIEEFFRFSILIIDKLSLRKVIHDGQQESKKREQWYVCTVNWSKINEISFPLNGDPKQ